MVVVNNEAVRDGRSRLTVILSVQRQRAPLLDLDTDVTVYYILIEFLFIEAIRELRFSRKDSPKDRFLLQFLIDTANGRGRQVWYMWVWFFSRYSYGDAGGGRVDAGLFTCSGGFVCFYGIFRAGCEGVLQVTMRDGNHLFSSAVGLLTRTSVGMDTSGHALLIRTDGFPLRILCLHSSSVPRDMTSNITSVNVINRGRFMRHNRGTRVVSQLNFDGYHLDLTVPGGVSCPKLG